MFRLMRTVAILSAALLLAAHLPAAAQKADALSNLDRDLAKLRACYNPLNAGCVIDTMPPEILKLAGGKEALVGLMESTLKTLAEGDTKAQFDKVVHTPDKATSKLGDKLFVRVLQKYPVRLQGKEGHLSGALVAISTDEGVSWKFADASSREAFEQFYPGAWDLLKVDPPKFEPKT